MAIQAQVPEGLGERKTAFGCEKCGVRGRPLKKIGDAGFLCPMCLGVQSAARVSCDRTIVSESMAVHPKEIAAAIEEDKRLARDCRPDGYTPDGRQIFKGSDARKRMKAYLATGGQQVDDYS